MNTTHIGKIGRLPGNIRQSLGERIEEGIPNKELVVWLNGLPEVKDSLALRFGGRAITEQNLSEWKQTGHLAWLRREGCDYVFPSDHRIDRPISENTVLALIARMGYKGEMTGHGWRTVASTWANEHGYPPDAIERQLAHTPEDKVRATYNRAEYMRVRRPMMQEWADWLDGGAGEVMAEI